MLYSGTPCQLGGLRAYLGKDYDKLIQVDLICHGVPSPMVWQEYVEYRSKVVNGAKPRKISFRDKTDSWKKYSVFLKTGEIMYKQFKDGFVPNLSIYS